MSTALPVKYDTMCRAIDAAYKVDEVKDIRDKAIALEVYAKQAKNTEAERRACEIRLRAERKCGQLTAKMDKAQGKGKRTDKSTLSKGATKSKQLKDAGITRDQASKWEKLGRVPDDEFELALANGEKPVKPKQNPVPEESLWLWGRLRDFEKMLLGLEPSDVMLAMTPEMHDEASTLAPKVAAWLAKI